MTPDVFFKKLLNEGTRIEIIMSGCVDIDEQWRIDQRSIADHLFYYVTRGEIIGCVHQNQIRIRAGEVLWVQSQVQQSFTCAGPNEGFYDESGARVYFMRVRVHGQLRLDTDYIHARTGATLIRSWEQITNGCSHLKNSVARFREIQLRCAITEFIITILDAGTERDSLQGGLSLAHKESAQQFIRSQIESRFTVADIAEHLGLHRDYFSRQFKKTFASTVQNFIKEERIHTACGLLSEGGRSISQVAEVLGYDDVYFFSRQFKSVMNYSPRHWLQQLDASTRS